MRKLVKRFALFTALFILISAISSFAVSGQVGIGVSPSVLNMGAIAMNGTAQQTMRIYDTSNNTAINYTVAPRNVSGVSISPNQGSIQPKSNVSVLVTVTADTQQGIHQGWLIVNTTARSSSQVEILPALAPRIQFIVANYSAPPQPSNGTNWELIGSVIGLVATGVVIVAAVYMLKRR